VIGGWLSSLDRERVEVEVEPVGPMPETSEPHVVYTQPESQPQAAPGADFALGYSPDRGINWAISEVVSRTVWVDVPGDGSLSLRDLPSGAHGDLLHRIPAGTRLSLTRCLPPRPEDGGRWCETSHAGQSGWVYDRYAREDGNGTATEASSSDEADYALGYSPNRGVNWTLVDRGERYGRVAVPERRPVPLRHVPSREHGRSLVDIPSGTELRLFNCLPRRPEDGARWCETSYGGQSGWVYDRFISAASGSRPSGEQGGFSDEGRTPDVNTDRLTFERGATSVSASGSVDAARTARYLLNVRRGQLLRVSVTTTSGMGDAYVEVYGPDRPIEPGHQAPSDVSGSRRWEGRLSRSGDYQVVVRSRGGEAGYEVTVEAY
jgi:uncharacterized protein YraI